MSFFDDNPIYPVSRLPIRYEEEHEEEDEDWEDDSDAGSEGSSDGDSSTPSPTDKNAEQAASKKAAMDKARAMAQVLKTGHSSAVVRWMKDFAHFVLVFPVSEPASECFNSFVLQDESLAEYNLDNYDNEDSL